MIGLVTKSTGLWYEILLNGDKRMGRIRGRIRLATDNTTNPVAVGDCVEVMPNEEGQEDLIILSVLPRENYVIRRSPKKRGMDHILASNIDQGLLLATLKKPRTSLGFIDRFLISLEAFRIPGILIFNKRDLYSTADLDTYESIKEVYLKIGYQVHLISVLEDEELVGKSLLEHKRSLLIGHSGSGKSTLVNRLIPQAHQNTNEVSSFANKGKHTTTFAQMFHMDRSSSIIDTPGIKELGLAQIKKDELSHYFPEMRALLGQCRFHNCLHLNEAGCAIKENLGGSISELRYGSYLSILNEEDSHR